MRIQSEDDLHFIRLTLQEVNVLYYPSVRVQIEASAHGFSASMDSVWWSIDDMHVFLTDLVRLEQQRAGTAVLVSMSPSEAILSFQSVDRVGHMIAKIDLTRSVFISSGAQSIDQHLSVAFDIDVSLLPTLIRSFEQLIPLFRGAHPFEKDIGDSALRA
ncbi:hypothetical protein KDW_31890 [Dictyobacter vulcani]|uniref:Uncharacterized protein n=1 Tax=Dictyobacter vulcani TaxID=2607529 RepID=A0A5J4KRM4_9CHLR|nr:hypothetical protein [Dictyobacter vulcani]GER89027.1 hypothetical protein KDW_31890 [Dictyobacter vulcani]